MPISAAQASRARIACQRFGLGPTPGLLERIGAAPFGALKAELDRVDVALITAAGLPSRATATRKSQDGFQAAEEIRQLELDARVDKHLSAGVGFVERLVLFWSNHFSMSVNKDDVVRATIGQLERDVIRKNVLGKFPNMLRGVMRHPAMIRYLDNQDSRGPNSERGDWGGFNENLAREVMELHTLGSGAYSERDVTNLSLILTGWSYIRSWEVGQDWADAPGGKAGEFYFREKWHEPGAIKLRGKSYPAGGISQGLAALDDLARAPETAQHIAFKLVRHFITDDPTPKMVKPVADAFLKSGGDLKKTAVALISLPEAWSAGYRKIRTPYELAIAQFRAFGRRYKDDRRWVFTEPLRAMYHLPWERPTPDGFPDETLAWLDPDGMTIRLDTAQLAAWEFGAASKLSPLALGRSLYGAALSDDTNSALTWITDKTPGYTVLFMSPEFQRR